MNIDDEITDRLLRLQLQSIRKSRHLTQEQLSKTTGLSKSTISHIESSDTSPTLRSVIKYANALDASINIIYLKEMCKIITK